MIKLDKVGMVALAALATIGAVGCGSDPGAGAPVGAGATLDTSAKIEGYIETRALLMAGDDIPTHPNGFLEDMNLEQATQCYHKVEMTLSGSNFHVKSELGTLQNAPNKGDVGSCDVSTMAAALEFNSTSHLIENIQGDAECFDFTISYAGFGQEGRGRIDKENQSLELELYFKDQATNAKCADGPPGTAGVQLNGAPFEGDSVQVYRIQE